MNNKTILNAKLVADYFVYRGVKDKNPISNKKLQKLLYYAQAWSLVLRGKRLFNEKIEAWVHGPAVREIYIKYKKYGFDPINEVIELDKIKSIPKDVKNLLNEIWKVYGSKDANYLEMLTHSEKPWQEARGGLNSFENSENIISKKSMQEFYSKLLEQVKKN